MSKHVQIFAALLLAVSSAGLSACGDEENGGGTNEDERDADTGGEADSGEDEPRDAGGGRQDSGGDGGGGGSDDGGEDAPDADDPGPVEPLGECPDHPAVTAKANLKICEIAAPKNKEITEPLELAPVEGYLGYLLKGVVYVGQDVGGGATPTAGKKTATLTIKPGTMLAGADANSALAINRGSKIEAVGTADEPIVFTSVKTLAGESGSAPTDWGGVIIMGRAPHNRGPNTITELDTGMYGGEDPEDDSGTLKYVRVEFSGARSSSTKEFNGVSFYGVGSGTDVDYIHTHAGSDDGIEFFGGTVNAKHLVVTGHGDDGIDWTDGYVGKIQFAVVQQYSGYGDNGIEANNHDTNETLSPRTDPTVANVTLIGNNALVTGGTQNGMLLRFGNLGSLHNMLLLNFYGPCVSVQNQETSDAVGDGRLTLDTSAIFCATSFATGSSAAWLTAAEDLFNEGTDNQILPNKDVLQDAYNTEGAHNFLPKSSSGLLTGASIPDDDFFEDVDFIGAFGSEDWTAGNWVKITEFEPK